MTSSAPARLALGFALLISPAFIGCGEESKPVTPAPTTTAAPATPDAKAPVTPPVTPAK